jgi:hypothetical protein
VDHVAEPTNVQVLIQAFILDWYSLCSTKSTTRFRDYVLQGNAIAVEWVDRDVNASDGSSSQMDSYIKNVKQWLAPVTIRKEDCVCRLPGCNAPVIMREVTTPDGMMYEVIGEAYVEGLSHGEFEELSNSNLQEFYLV